MKPDAHLESLVAAYLEGRCDADALAKLEAHLLEDAESRRYFLETVLLDEDLGMLSDARPAKAGDGPLPVELLLQRQRRRAVRTSLLAAAAVIIVSAMVLWWQMVPERPATLGGFRVAPNSAFILTHTGDGKDPMGNVLAEGSSIVVNHGVIELALPHDVRAVVEAPAAMTLLDVHTLQLDRGRAFFEVSSRDGRGFTVVTPHQRIVDLGTAFGVDTQPERDEVKLHVFEGRVRVDPPDGGTGEIIAASRSVLLAGSQVREDLSGPPAAFRRKLPAQVETLFLEDFESGLVGGRNYAVLIDPTVVRDLAGNRFAGIDDTGTWNFRTSMVVTEAAAYHDLGGEASPGHITTQRRLNETVSLINLADGTDTGIDFRIEGATGIDERNAGETMPPAAGTPAASLFLGSGIDLGDGFVHDAEHESPGPATFHFTGLNPRLRYDVALYGDRSLNSDGKERFTLKGAEKAQNRSTTGIVDTMVAEMETRPNFSAGHVVRWVGIDPGADGAVSIEIDPSVSGKENLAYVSALRVAATTTDGLPTNFNGVPIADASFADGDGLPDSFELAHTDPPSATALDPDEDLENGGRGDGLNNLQEFQHGTDPRNADSDGDGVPDGAELVAGTDPTAAPAADEPDRPASTQRDLTPPVNVFLHPAHDSSGTFPGGSLTMTFNEPIKLGTGRVTLRNVTDWKKTVLTVGDPRLSVDGRVLTIVPPATLTDGEIQLGRVHGWECHAHPGIFNPGGDGTWYGAEGLKDDSRSRGTIGAMRGPIMATFGECRPRSRMRREFGTIAPDTRYTVSTAIGVRAAGNGPAFFDGYTIRLVSGDTVLAELANDTPPGPPDSVTTVGFSWDSSTLPEGVSPGDPLAIEIAPNQASGEKPGYLDIDHVRVTAVKR